jgi:hypothetical protein
MRFLLYGPHGLIDANIPTVAALRERLRLEAAGRPSATSDLYVLVFDRADGRFLGRRDVVIEDGYPIVVSPGGSQLRRDHRSRTTPGWADTRCTVV